jgi:dTDP-4-dehydrorhamnose reductase
MNILLIGKNGLLGHDLLKKLSYNHQIIAPAQDDLNIINQNSITTHFSKYRFDWCINCAAYTQVDLAESMRNQCYQTNVLGAENLALLCNRYQVRLLHISTDYVFDGKKQTPYIETDSTNPINFYGQTKLEGEKHILTASDQNIVTRVTWLFGAQRACFPEIIINAWESGKELKVVTDEVACPTYTVDLAATLERLMSTHAPGGIYHAVGPKALSRYDFAKMILETYRSISGEQSPITIEPISSNKWHSAAKRPSYSVLSHSKLSSLDLYKMPSLEESLLLYCQDLITNKTFRKIKLTSSL